MAARLLLAALFFVAIPVAAQVAPAPEPEPSEVADATADARVQHIDRHCLRHTGSHIRTRSTANRRACNSTGMGRVYSREDIDRTGHTDIAQALRTLDPSIY